MQIDRRIADGRRHVRCRFPFGGRVFARTASSARPSLRLGFTLIEVLVVIGIIGVMASLLLPGVQSAREAARRIQCSQNLHEIGLALHEFHATNNCFPIGRGAPNPAAFSAHAWLLPYLDQANLYVQIDFDAAPATFTNGATIVYDGTVNFPAACTLIPVFLCPSDPPQGRIPKLSYAGTNYVADAGSGQLDGGYLTTSDGVFGTGVAIRISDITDGTTNTVAFSERTLGNGLTNGADAGREMFQIAGNDSPSISECTPGSGGAWWGDRGLKWIFGNYGYTLFNHAVPPNSRQPDCVNATQQKAWTAARSLHPGGVAILMGDGSTRFLADSIDATIWKDMGSRNGNEVIGGN